MFVGYVTLEGHFDAVFLLRDAARSPVNADAPPTYRVYSPEGLVVAVTGVAAALDSGLVTGASVDSPIVITSAGHGLTTGAYVTLAGVGGATAANGSFAVTRTGANTFELDGSTGGGAYTSGGVWNVAGLYRYGFDASAADGFEVGQTYQVVVEGLVAGVPTAEVQAFIVV